MTKHLNIKVYGRVQGVFFRYSTQNKAKELGVAGFTRNEDDGTVYIEAEGEEDALEKFSDWCKEGTESAEIDRVEITEGEINNFAEFKIEY